MKAVIYSLGCKVNQIEGQSIAFKLQEQNIEVSSRLEFADIYVINTCSVTGMADRKSRQAVAKSLKLNPNAKIYVCGCSSQNNAAAYETMANVHLIGGLAAKQSLITRIMSDIICNADQKPCKLHDKISCISELPLKYEDDLKQAHNMHRAFIKIQDGCDNFCSYCIVPFLRGRSRSREIKSIICEAESAAAYNGEIVLSGINISDYGSNIGIGLTDLVNSLGTVKIRKRFGSLECGVVSESLLEAMAKNGFCDHFHLSLQSGSDSVLKRMNRHYTSDFFYNKVQLIRNYFPNAGITTDIIAGFGEESENEHRETIAFMQKINFSDAHVFPYSERVGTNAVKLKQNPKPVRDERAAEITLIKNQSKAEFISSQSGNTAEVCVCDSEGEYNVGVTANYVKVFCAEPCGTVADYVLGTPYKDGIIGKPIAK